MVRLMFHKFALLNSFCITVIFGSFSWAGKPSVLNIAEAQPYLALSGSEFELVDLAERYCFQFGIERNLESHLHYGNEVPYTTRDGLSGEIVHRFVNGDLKDFTIPSQTLPAALGSKRTFGNRTEFVVFDLIRCELTGHDENGRADVPLLPMASISLDVPGVDLAPKGGPDVLPVLPLALDIPEIDFEDMSAGDEMRVNFLKVEAAEPEPVGGFVFRSSLLAKPQTSTQGLANYGANCFANAAIQFLARQPKILELEKTVRFDYREQVYQDYRAIFFELVKKLKSDTLASDSGLLQKLFEAFRKIPGKENFRFDTDSDAEEFLIPTMRILGYGDQFEGFRQSSRLQTLGEVKSVKLEEQLIGYLNLIIQNDAITSVQKAFESFFLPEPVVYGGENLNKRTYFVTGPMQPEALVVNLKRGSFSEGRAGFNTKAIDVSEEIIVPLYSHEKLGNFSVDPEDYVTMRPLAVIFRVLLPSGRGHYYSGVIDYSKKKIVIYNDTEVTEYPITDQDIREKINTNAVSILYWRT